MALGRSTLLLVLGAGASYDSIRAPEERLRVGNRPPMTAGLFGEGYLEQFMSRRGSARSLAATVAAALERTGGSAFEETLEDLYRTARGNRNLERGFTALRFYLRDLFKAATFEWPSQVGGVTNHQWLVRAVEAWRGSVDGYVVWVTFNYDGLLDSALEDFYSYDLGNLGTDDPHLQAYVAHPDWALVKLHGSHDWARRTGVLAEDVRSPSDDYGAYLKLVAEWDAESDPPTAETRFRRVSGLVPDGDAELWVPALMAPLATKSDFECPPAHRSHFEARLPDVDLIFTVGWSAQDAHFLATLDKSRINPPDVWAVSRHFASALEVAQRVGNACGPFEPSERARRGPGHLHNRNGLEAKGFSALVLEQSDFAGFLTKIVGTARERREQMLPWLHRHDIATSADAG